MTRPENPPISHEESNGQSQAASQASNASDQAQPSKPVRHEVRDWLMFGVTLILVIATIFYVHYAKSQRDAMLNQTNAIIAQRDVMIQQVNASQRQVDEMKTQSGTFDKTLIETQKGANAAVQSADAGQDSAKAAQQSVGITQRSFTLLERPSLGVEYLSVPIFAIGSKVVVRLHLKNFGHIPAQNITTEHYVFARPTTSEAPCVNLPTLEGLRGVRSRSFIAAGGAETVLAATPTVADATDIERIVTTKSHWIYVYMVVRYGARQEYFIEYYTRWDIENQAWISCEETHNRAN